MRDNKHVLDWDRIKILCKEKHKFKRRLKEGSFVYKNLEEVMNSKIEVGIISTVYVNLLIRIKY